MRDVHSEYQPQRVRVALAGCGVVGGSLIRLLAERGPTIETSHGLELEVVRVLVRDPERSRRADLEPDLITTSLREFLETDADIVVEAIGGLEPAAEIARTTLGQGRDLITANKALLAEYGAELAETVHRTGARLEFEAAVGGGAPVIQTLRDSLAETDVVSIQGILNGTSNYILTRLSEDATYDTALDDAQRAGYAEADPTRDLDGTDAADKIRILAWLAFGIDPAQLEVDRRGILTGIEELISEARDEGGVVRLVAECRREGSEIRAVVEPRIVAKDSEWARTLGAENLVVFETRWNGVIRVSGPGAGGKPTASAVLSDLVRAARLHAISRSRRVAA